MLIYGRNQHNIVKQLSFQLRTNNFFFFLPAGLGDYLDLVPWEAEEGVKDFMRIHLVKFQQYCQGRLE